MSLTEMRQRLIAASDKAQAALQTELTNKLARNAIREEAEDFRVYVETLTPEDLVQVEALPYRRVLSKEGSERLWAELRKIWSGASVMAMVPFKGRPCAVRCPYLSHRLL
jgi:hypothetical protein